LSGAALQRVIALVAQVAIARIVGPSALGELAVAQAVIVFSGALVSQLWAPETKGMSLSETAHLYSH